MDIINISLTNVNTRPCPNCSYDMLVRGKKRSLCALCHNWHGHYTDVIMGTMAPPITSLTIVYSTVYSGADQIKHQSSASLAFVWGIHREPVNSPHKWLVTRKMFPFDDIIMTLSNINCQLTWRNDFTSTSTILAMPPRFKKVRSRYIKGPLYLHRLALSTWGLWHA